MRTLFDDMPEAVRADITRRIEHIIETQAEGPWRELLRADLDLHRCAYDSSIRRLEKLANHADKSVQEHALTSLGLLYAMAGDTERALDLYSQARAVVQKAGQAIVFAAGIYFKRGDLKTAEELYRSVVRDLGPDDEVVAAEVAADFGQLLSATARSEEAKRLLGELRERYPRAFERAGSRQPNTA